MGSVKALELLVTTSLHLLHAEKKKIKHTYFNKQYISNIKNGTI